MPLYALDSYRLLLPEEIAEQKVAPSFPHKGRTEEMYKHLIECCQPLFEDFEDFLREKNKMWVGPSGLIAQLTPAEFSNMSDVADPVCVWLDSGNCVTVNQLPDGTFEMASNGRHRLYIAKKYGYRIPVFVAAKTLQPTAPSTFRSSRKASIFGGFLEKIRRDL